MNKADFIYKWARRFRRNNNFLISPEDFQEFAQDVGYFFGLFKSTGAVFLNQKAGITSFSLGPAQRDATRLRIRKFGNAGLLKSLPALPLPADRPANTPAPGDVLSLTASGVPVAGSPEISEFGETVLAGQSIEVTGEQLTSTKAAIFANGKLLPAAVAGNTSQVAAIQLPTNAGAFGASVLWLENGQGYGEPVLLNRTHATWMSTTLAAGVTGHVLGLNLTHGNVAGGASYLYLVHKVSGDVVAVPVLPDTIPERISFTTPAVPLGEYWVYPHNGHGGEWGWSERLSCTIVGANDHVKTHEWQVGNAIVNTGGNMAPTINAALLSDSRSNKHTVLAAGTWLAGEGIEIVSNCSLRGQVDGNGVPTTIITPDPARFDFSGDRGLLGSPAPKEMVRLENLIIDNSKGAAMGPVNRLVVLRRCRQVWLKNVWVIQPGGGLVRLDEDTSGLYIDDCKLWGGSNANGEPIFVLPSPEAQLFINNTEFKLYDNADSALNVSGVSQVAILPGCTVGNGDDTVLNGAFAGKGRFLKGSGAYGIGSECWHAEGVVGTNLGVMRDWLGTTSNPVLNATSDDNEGEGLMYEGAETRGKLPVISATRTTITSSSKPTSDKYTGAAPFAHYAHIVRGRGMGQMRRIVANDGNGTLTFDKPWRVVPDSTSLVMYGTYCRFVHVVDCDFSARPGMNGTNYSASKFLEVYGGCHKWRAKRNKIKGFRSGLSTFTTQHNSNDFIDSCSHNDLTDNILIECRYSVRIEVTGEGGGGLPSGGGYPASGQVALHLRNQVVNPVLYNTIIAAARTDDPTTATNFPYPLITGLLIEGDQPVLPFPNDYRTTSNPQRFPVIDVGAQQLAGVVLAVAAATATALVGNTTDDLGPPEPLPTPASFTADKLSFPNTDPLVLGGLDDQSEFVPFTRTPADAGATTTPAPGGGYTDAQIDSLLATKQNVVVAGSGTVVRFTEQKDYPPILSGTFTVDAAGAVLGTVVFAELGAATTQPVLDPQVFELEGGSYQANKRLSYGFRVSASGKIRYVITVLP
jgi:hypothetical protein